MGYPQLYRGYYGRGVRERGQAGSASTGTIAATASSNDKFWTLRYPEITPMPGASPYQGKRLYVQRIVVQWTTIVTFTTAVTAGRVLHLHRGAPTAGTASNPSGGSAFNMVRKRSDTTSTDEVLAVGRVASTGALTTTGLTFETNAIRTFNAVDLGTSGNSKTVEWRFDGVVADPIYLLPGEVLAIAAGQNMDAAGTFQLVVDVDAVEIVGV